jgi:hypothetical protein
MSNQQLAFAIFEDVPYRVLSQTGETVMLYNPEISTDAKKVHVSQLNNVVGPTDKAKKEKPDRKRKGKYIADFAVGEKIHTLYTFKGYVVGYEDGRVICKGARESGRARYSYKPTELYFGWGE